MPASRRLSVAASRPSTAQVSRVPLPHQPSPPASAPRARSAHRAEPRRPRAPKAPNPTMSRPPHPTSPPTHTDRVRPLTVRPSHAGHDSFTFSHLLYRELASRERLAGHPGAYLAASERGGRAHLTCPAQPPRGRALYKPPPPASLPRQPKAKRAVNPATDSPASTQISPDPVRQHQQLPYRRQWPPRRPRRRRRWSSPLRSSSRPTATASRRRATPRWDTRACSRATTSTRYLPACTTHSRARSFCRGVLRT
jgi:hypothetical protein